MTSERMIMVPDWLVEEAASLIEQAGMSGTGVSLTAPRLRAALAQPSAGEPEQQTAINADDLPTKKYPLGAFDFDAPVAAGEPVAFSTEHGALFWHGSPQDWKGKPVQLYLAPPAAAHGDEAVQIKLPDFIRCSDEMHERGEKAVERAIKDQCFDRRTQFKVYFEAAIGEWFSQQKADAMRAQAGEGVSDAYRAP